MLYGLSVIRYIFIYFASNCTLQVPFYIAELFFTTSAVHITFLLYIWAFVTFPSLHLLLRDQEHWWHVFLICLKWDMSWCSGAIQWQLFVNITKQNIAIWVSLTEMLKGQFHLARVKPRSHNVDYTFFFQLYVFKNLSLHYWYYNVSNAKVPLWYNIIYQGKRAADGNTMILMICLLCFPIKTEKFPYQYYKEGREKPPQIPKLLLFWEGVWCSTAFNSYKLRDVISWKSSVLRFF